MSLKLKPSEVSNGLFFFLYSEIVRSFQQKVTAIHDLEQKLHSAGRHLKRPDKPVTKNSNINKRKIPVLSKDDSKN